PMIPAKGEREVASPAAVKGTVSGVPAPTGTVSFLDGSTVLATVPLSSGTASYTTSTLTVGKHPIMARYNGNDYYTIVSSASMSQVIHPITLFTVGGAPGHVLVYKPDNTLLAAFVPYGPAYTGGINVAVGDVTGDGYYDVVTGAAVGNPHVKVYNGKTFATGAFNPANPDGSLVASFFPYALQFNVGATVAVGDVTGDGHAQT